MQDQEPEDLQQPAGRLLESSEPRAWVSVHDSELKQLHRAACIGGSYTVEELLSCKKSLMNSRDGKNRTALHLACISSQSSVVALLIQWNCNLDACDKESKTALIKKVQHPSFAKLIQAWQEPMINTETKDGVLKPGTSTSFEDNNSDNKNEDVVTTFPQPSTEVPGFSHPAFPAPEPLTSSAVLGVTEEGTTKPKTGKRGRHLDY
ncbi:ankyrin repeat domain-containing protein 26-like [Vicugna pacos]|uniref:Ankyrin repeat domain-containing protein 26-like n=1 Tax=Vicugna pacos TaxID=30538 RepID=A0ABM5CRK2_VICPA